MKITSGKKRVIFYLVDGARPDVLTKLVDDGSLPNIKKYLVDQGSYTKGSTCFPSTTGPAYLPFLTGYHPGDHDITGIRWFDKKAYFQQGKWSRNSMRSYCGYEAKYFNNDMHDQKPSLFEEYPGGLNIYNMITKGVRDEDDLTKDGKTKLYFRAHFYHEHHPVDEAGHTKLLEAIDKDPHFVFAVFPSVDWDAHTYHYESEQAVNAYKIADRSLGEVVEKLTANGMIEDTLIIMCSDHGLSSTHTHLDLGKYFKKKGYRILEYPTIHRIWPNLAVFISGNSFASLSFLDNKEHYFTGSLKKKHGEVLDEFVTEAAIDFIIYRDSFEVYRIQNQEGEAIIKIDQAKQFTYEPLSSDPLGIGPIDSPIDKHEAFQRTFDSQYPDALHQIEQLMSSERAGDVVISAATGFDLREFWEIPEHKGSHGSLHWEHMHVPILTNQSDLIDRPVRTSHIHKVIKEWLGKPNS